MVVKRERRSESVKDLQLGLDTELVAATQHGVLYPHVAKIPQERVDTTGLFDWHGDGYAWELCVAPSRTPSGIMVNVASGLFDLHRSWATTRLVGPSLYAVPARVVREAPREVKKLGCMPSLNLYAKPAIPKGLPGGQRTTGCHIHMSSPEINKSNYRQMIAWSDVLIGSVWSHVSPESQLDERTRRKYYGKAGEYRVRFYDEDMLLFGVEYRTLPGTVLHHPAYLSLMLYLATEVAQRARYGGPIESLQQEAARSIDRADRRGLVLPLLDLDQDMMEEIERVRNLKYRTVDLASWKQYLPA